MNVAIMCNGKNTGVPSRVELIESLKNNKNNVFIAGVETGELSPAYEEMGIHFMPILASRDNVNPFVELKSLDSVRKKTSELNINSALIYGVKNHIAMALGAKLGGAKKIVCVVNGSGNLFFQKGIKAAVVKIISWFGLKLAYSFSSTVVFQNPDDVNLFRKLRLVSAKKIINTNGSGVNTDKYEYVPVPLNDTFTMVSRLTVNKGTIDFIRAAEIVKKTYPDAKFKLIGNIESTMSEANKKIIENADKDGVIDYLGFQSNIKEHLENTMCFILPSYYREGVPRSVLEALAIGRPVITCNAPGCKETVVNDVNGFLVEPKSPQQLAEKILWMLENKEKLVTMGYESRKYAQKKFDINIVNEAMVRLL